jgi:uncharacterized protein
MRMQPMLRLTPADYRVMPWQNGGGTTTELYVEPAPDDLPDAPFLWRISIAEIASDGPFSIFAGCNRHIMTITGSGMVLSGGPNGPIDARSKFIPQSFFGDWPVSAHLIAGPVRDFNLIALRNHVASSLDCLSPRQPFQLGGEPGVTIFAHLIDGKLVVDGHPLAAGESFLLAPGEAVSATLPRRPIDLRIALCRIRIRDRSIA